MNSDNNKIINISTRQSSVKLNSKMLKWILAFVILLCAITYGARYYCDYPGTIGLIGINGIIFILIQIKKINWYDLGTSYNLTVEFKQYYRIITSAFTHQEPLHILCNLASLYNLGPVIEQYLGTVLYLIVYFIIMIVGGSISCMIRKRRAPRVQSIGASGVICGLLGIYIAVAFMYWGFGGIRSIIPTLVILVLMTFDKHIDSVGHFSGLAVGICIGIVLNGRLM